jgi:pimeloyl-ACP methyl ester carboxylesterase
MNLHRRSLIAALLAGCATRRPVEEGGLTHALGYHIAYAKRGGASPTIVFESGLGDGLEIWAGVIGQLGPEQAYFAYSRPGYGESEGYEQPIATRTSREASELLHAVLHSANIGPPYVLVGHSLGGLYIARYAAEFPEEAAGLIFVDGRPPTFRTACDARGVRFCSTTGSAAPPPKWPAHIVAELQGMYASEEIGPAMAAIAAIPATIITSTNVWPGEQGDEGFALWLETQEAFAQRFTSHRLVRAEGAGHYVHREQSALVAREIEGLLARLHTRR